MTYWTNYLCFSFLSRVFILSYSSDKEFHAQVMKAFFSLLLSVYCTQQDCGLAAFLFTQVTTWLWYFDNTCYSS